MERGYDLTLFKDAHTTGNMDLGNIAMTWLSYPGRTNRIATAGELDFATPGGVRQ